ncbi:MAG: hypothetical protein HUJ98_12990, partial [Bacteroidaceae bacterium]|nr:hypothetical protein [Bacteroidaceae bacterium]
EGAAENWTDFAGTNQIADITESNLDVTGGGHNDSEAVGSGMWYLSNQDNAAANASIEVKDSTPWAKVNVTGAGNQDYGVQLIGHYNAKKGYVYKVSFDAYAEGDMVGKTVNCDSKEYQGWSTYGVKQFALKNNVEHTEYIFEQTEDFDNCRIEFNIGGVGTGAVYVSNVKVEIIDPASLGTNSADGTHGVMANGNMIFNGSFDQGSNHLGYWKASGGTECIVPRYTTTALAANDKRVKDVASITNYEKLSDGIKYYERRAQISGNEETAPQIYQPGIKMNADSYTVKFDLYSEKDTAVKASICTLKFDTEGNVVGVDRELASAKASYDSGDGVKGYTLSLTTKEDVANGALVLTFAKSSSVYLDNVTMTGANQVAGFDENPMDGNITWEGHDATDQPFAIKDNGNGCFMADKLTSGGAWYQPQIGSSNFETVSGVKYDLSFKFRLEGDSNKSFEYIVQEAGGSWTVVKEVTKVDFSEMKEDAEGFFTYTTQFTAAASLSDCHFVFGFGNSAVNNSAFTFKDVKLTTAKAEAGEAGAFDNDEKVSDE